ncbi:response regulator transcription factor [Achromobacter pestifer]|uniref:Transcriptional regulatory protein DegU n=1 Tax=Achromobacter pestifer TaxID=1353889 RepID=A0A6S7A962_9BURK|nr:response regulator transcription factor [Achromobacter pestifer]CAB3708591.1 Transcriptional regulatory protein DegU [Achromobacter pestifer]
MLVFLIADDHPLFREALCAMIVRMFPRAVVHEADHVSKLYGLVDAWPDAALLLLNLNLPGGAGYGPLAHVRDRHPQLPIIILSARDDPVLMRRSMDHGVQGFIPKSIDAATLGDALRHVLGGGAWLPERSDTAGSDAAPPTASTRDLTPQQFRVLQMVAAGLLNKQIAHELHVSEATVKSHMTAVMRKLSVTNRTQAVLMTERLRMRARHYTPPR